MFHDLGVGVGLRPTHYFEFESARPPESVSWVEVISENFMDWADKTRPQRALQHLEKIRARFPVVLHGVSLSVGSTDPLSQSHLKRLNSLINRIEPEWVSDHLCWTGVDGRNFHDLLPIPYTTEALKTVVKNVANTQDVLKRQILIENPSSYIQFKEQDMTEWEFMRAVAQQADCGILLDINNIYVSSVNHGFDPMEYLRAIPWERVGQIHLAGHSNQGSYLVDTHDQPVCAEVWKLYRWAVKNRPSVSTMLERDDNIPEWKVLEKEILKISRIRESAIEVQHGRFAPAPARI